MLTRHLYIIPSLFIAATSQIAMATNPSDVTNLPPAVTTAQSKTDSVKIIDCEPYLHNPSSQGVTVMWQTAVPCVGTLYYGTDPDSLKAVRTLLGGQADWGTLHRVKLDGLDAGKKYYYRTLSRHIKEYGAYTKVFGDSVLTEMSTFTLPSSRQKDFTALIFNDLHQQAKTLEALYAQVRELPYDFVVFNGDTFDELDSISHAKEFLRLTTRTVGASRVPVYYLRGNHEIRGRYSVELRYLFDRGGDKTYGAFNWGNTRFVMLDCGEDKPDSTWVYFGLNDFNDLRLRQRDFLKAEMKSKEFKRARHRVLIHHIPVYGNDLFYTKYNPCLEPWDETLKKTPFNVSLNAHTHNFKWHLTGSRGNSFPVAIGGGFAIEDATVMVLTRRGDQLRLKVLNTKGETLLDELL